MASQTRFERATRSLGNCCSVHLSYWDENGERGRTRTSSPGIKSALRCRCATRPKMAEGAGFEPAGPWSSGFRDRRLKPLGHPSRSCAVSAAVKCFHVRALPHGGALIKGPWSDVPESNRSDQLGFNSLAFARHGAGERTRTVTTSLEGWGATITSHPLENGLSARGHTRISGFFRCSMRPRSTSIPKGMAACPSRWGLPLELRTRWSWREESNFRCLPQGPKFYRLLSSPLDILHEI